jgi:tRNA pseudouridine38/39 synthase
MGAALPLQLYRCGYDSGAIDWRYGGFDGPVAGEVIDEQTQAKAREGHMSVLTSLKSQAEEARIKARQIEAFYQEAVQVNRPDGLVGELSSIDDVPATSFTLGGGEVQAGRKYIKFLDRPRGDPVEEQNRRWREGKGENRRLRKLAESDLGK